MRVVPIAYSSSRRSRTRCTPPLWPCPVSGTGQVPSLQAERVRGTRTGVADHRLRLEVQLERLDPELAPEARLLVTAERNAREGRVRHIDPDGAGLQPLRHPRA